MFTFAFLVPLAAFVGLPLLIHGIARWVAWELSSF